MNTTTMSADMTDMNGHTSHMGGNMPHADNPGKMKEHGALMELVPESKTTHVAVKSGSWFDASTWEGGNIPGDEARVVIEEGVNVRYDDESDARLKTVRLDGTLTFAHNKNTKMVVDTFVATDKGTLNIGTATNPIQANKTAQIIIANEGKIDTNWDPTQLSRGLVTHGKVRIYGADKTDFIALAQDAEAGDNELILKNKPTGWAVGDKLVLGGTNYGYLGSDEDNSRFRDEELTITEISGNRVKFTNDDITEGDNTVLRFDHVRPDIAEKDQLNLYLANTTRNVTIESEGGETTPTGHRGHVMFMHNPDVQVHNVGFYHLGRSDKTKLVDDVGQNVDGSKGSGTNIRGRYAAHFHRTGADDINGQAAVLEGSAVVGSPGWGIVHHDSNAIIKDNVVFDVVGTGIAAESGNELGRWENNITIKTTGVFWEKARDQKENRERKFDFGFRGEGYWVQGAAQIAMKDNVAISANNTGITVFGDSLDHEDFRDKETIKVKNLAPSIRDQVAQPGQEEVDVTDVPLRQLSGFESYNTNTGLRVWGQMTNFDGNLSFSSPEPKTAHQARGRIDDFTLWGNHWSGLQVFYSSNLDFENGLVVGDIEDPRGGSGLFHNHATFNTHYKNLNVKGFNQGLNVEFLNEERDFTQSSIANSKFSDNTYNLKKIGDEAPHMEGDMERPDDFPEAFAIRNTIFEAKEGNKAPTAKFSESAKGGLAVNFNASSSQDSDPLRPDGISPKYPIDSRGIASYAWDFNSDGKLDQFGRQVTHQFDRAGTYNVTLQVMDNQGATQTLTKAVTVEPKVYPNAFKDGTFSNGKYLEVWQANSQWADDGWSASEGVSRSNGTAVLSEEGDWGKTLTQVVENGGVHQGEQTLSFRLKNVEGSDKFWLFNEVKVRLWGIDGQFGHAPWDDIGPEQVGTLPMARTLVHEQAFGGENGEFFNWKNFSSNVDLGDGYDYLMFHVQTRAAADKGDSIAIDNVKLAGEYSGSSSAPEPTLTPEPIPQPTPEPPPQSTPQPAPQPKTITREGLVAALRLDETSGRFAADSSKQGRYHKGKLFGDATWTDGIRKGAVSFDGKGDAIRLNNSTDINRGIYDERTVSLWFKADNLASGQKQVIYEEGASVRGVNVYIDGDQLYVGGWNTPEKESGWDGTWLSTDKFSAGEWNHVALVLDGDKTVKDGAFQGYINGESFGKGEGSQLWDHAGGIGLGSIHRGTRFHNGATSGSNGFEGAIDDVMIYNNALSDSQVKTLATV